MINLLKNEWIKITNYRTFILLFGLFVICILILNLFISQILFPRNEMIDPSLLLGQPFSYPKIWQTVGYYSSFLLFIPGLALMISISNEYNFRTHRQSIIDGLSRNQFVLSKTILLFLIALTSTSIVFCTTLIYGINSSTPFTFLGIHNIFYFFLQTCVYLAVAFLFALIFKRHIVGVGIYFMYIFILDNILSAIITRKIGKIGYFTPLEAADKLLPQPIDFINDLENKDMPNEIILLVVSLLYLGLILYLCNQKFNKEDL